jgi:hypothetical protein
LTFKITPEIRRVFDRIFELQTQKAQSTEGASTLKQEARTREAEGDVARPVWRSNIIEALKSWPQSKGTPAQFMAHLKNVKGATEEAKWVDLKSFLEGKASVTRAQVEEFIAKNPLVVDMVTIPESKADPKHLMVRIKGALITGMLLSRCRVSINIRVRTSPKRRRTWLTCGCPVLPAKMDVRYFSVRRSCKANLHQRRSLVWICHAAATKKLRLKTGNGQLRTEREAEKARTLANEYSLPFRQP